MTGLRATEEVSLNGSPTVSPMTVASCSGVPFFRVPNPRQRACYLTAGSERNLAGGQLLRAELRKNQGSLEVEEVQRGSYISSGVFTI
jgi:hypothetical protein